MRRLASCSVMLIMLATSSRSLGQAELAASQFDADNNKRLDRTELKVFYSRALASPAERDDQRAMDTSATDFADDAITWRCASCTEISFEDAEAYVANRRDRIEQAKAREATARTHLGWPGLSFSRFIVDSPDPRARKYNAPFIFSYRLNTEADEDESENTFTVLGGVQLFEYSRDLDERQHGTSQIEITPGIDLDLDSSEAVAENSIEFGVPVFYRHIWDLDDILESITVGVTPTYETDRDFRRDVVEGDFFVTPTIPRLAAGFIEPPLWTEEGKPSWLSVFWLPTFQVQVGRVADAGVSADDESSTAKKLRALEDDGTYARLVPRFMVSFYTPRLLDGLRLQYEYFHYFDVTNSSNDAYGELRLLYDLAFKNLVQLTLIYRNGRQPPTFDQVNELLVGIGIQQ